jgi:hypothetical protein
MKAENAVVIIQCREWILRNKTQASNYKIGDIIVGWLYITVVSDIFNTESAISRMFLAIAQGELV